MQVFCLFSFDFRLFFGNPLCQGSIHLPFGHLPFLYSLRSYDLLRRMGHWAFSNHAGDQPRMACLKTDS